MNNNNNQYLPGLFTKKGNYWYNGNQQSTYELCIYIQYKLNKSDEWMNNIYNIVKNDEKTYGTFADLNNWSHIFTDDQLNAFETLISSIN